MLASGFAGLGYQIVWTQQCALWLGHEAAAVLAVVAAFFGGLAAGAFAFGARIEASLHPVRWYAACEITIGVWSLVLTLLLPRVSDTLLHITGINASPAWQWTVAFCGTFLILLPATAAMGATLPLMERAMAPLSTVRRSIGALYATNTFGAVLGVLASAFWLVPSMGLARTATMCVVLNVLCAVLALLSLRRSTPLAATLPSRDTRAVLVPLAITGLLGIGYEVVVVRVLSQVSEDTVYTFAMLLAVYLVGSAAGAATYQRWLAGRHEARAITDRLLCGLSAACLLGMTSLWAAEHAKSWMLQILGPGMSTAIAVEAMLAVFAFALPTFVMGTLFSHLSSAAVATGASLGRVLGVNTVGAATAPLIFGVLAVPMLGANFTLALICVGYIALTSSRAWRKPIAYLPASVGLIVAVSAPPLAFIDVPEGGRIVSYREGVMAAVSVVEDANGVAVLRINNRQQEGSSATLRVDGRQAWLPMLLHAAPQRALFLGLGTGVTASAAAADPHVQVDAVELLPEVIAASTHFTQALTDGAPNPRLHIMPADARRYMRASERQYDVIVADNFHPARSGSGSLYTVEHFGAVRARLAPGGLFCQWLPLHQLDMDTLRSIVQSFLVAFPDGLALLASNSLETPVIGLIGHAGHERFDVAATRERLAHVAPADTTRRFGIENELALFGSFIAGPSSLAHFARDTALNTDDHPIVAYSAPRVTYAPDSLPRDRLIELLHELTIEPQELIAGNDAAWTQRLGAYWTARNHFIESGRAVRPSSDVLEMLAQVREPLLAELRISPDFRPAYDPLLRMALMLRERDEQEARALLTSLVEMQPARPEAARVLAEMQP